MLIASASSVLIAQLEDANRALVEKNRELHGAASAAREREQAAAAQLQLLRVDRDRAALAHKAAAEGHDEVAQLLDDERTRWGGCIICIICIICIMRHAMFRRAPCVWRVHAVLPALSCS